MTYNLLRALGSSLTEPAIGETLSANLAASVAVRNTNNVWVDDGMVFNCHQCKKRFSLIIRKHHCRRCGNIFCYDCSNYFTIIPEFVTDCPEPADRWNVSHYITPLQSTEQRVCRLCYDTIREKIVFRNRIVQMLENPPSLDSIKSLSSSQGEIKSHYYDTLRNIQYCLPNHRYTPSERKFLLVNAGHFSKHSKYLVHLINSMEWSSGSNIESQLQLIGSVINGHKTKSCCDLYCTRTCQETLSVDDCITILHRGGGNLPEPIIRYLFQLITTSPDIIILCHITFFVNLILTANPLMREVLQTLLNRSDLLRYSTFWHLSSSLVAEGTDQSSNIKLFIEMFPRDQVRQMNRDHDFFLGLIENINRVEDYLKHHDFGQSPIVLPYRPSAAIVGVDLESIVISQSCSRPVIVRFYFREVGEDGQVFSYAARILFKPESIMNDVAVLSLMTLSEIILREQVDPNISAVTYHVMPITYASGMIEIVEQAETVHSIVERKKTILKHIVSKNEEGSVREALDRYLYSLVSYTLHSYFIGLGDRHLENIMVTDDGSIFHIDFGFILGTDAYPMTSIDIKLNSNMIDVIADDESDRHSRYLELCSQGVVVLRKFFNMFYIILSQSKTLSEKHVEKFIMSRFQPRQSDEMIVTELLAVIEKSHDAYSQYIRDFLHTHSKQGTVQNGIAAIIGTAVNAVRSVTG